MDMKLGGKTALITGGSVGIGLAVANALAKEKVNIVICSRNEDKVKKETERINNSFGVNSLGVKCDVTSVDDINHLIDAIKSKFPSIDILVNNAGTGSSEKIIDAADEKWQYYWDLHVMAAVRFTKAVVPLMRKKGNGS